MKLEERAAKRRHGDSILAIFRQVGQSQGKSPPSGQGTKQLNGEQAYKKEGPKFVQRLVAKQKAKVKDS